jgi:mono/diheme cytochrome c family protein
MPGDPVKVEVFLDNETEPLTTFRPPGTFELDTSKMEDGPHQLRIAAIDRSGVPGVRIVHFTVRNGPGISVAGIRPGDVVEGKVPVLINAYAGGHEDNFEPRRAETPTPVPTWAWVLFLGIVCWAMWYAASTWSPEPRFAKTPTFGEVVPPGAAASLPTAASAAAAIEKTPLGEQVFGNKCAACHQPDGAGVPGLFPSLRGDPVVLNPDATEQIHTVLTGLHGKEIKGESYASEMPAFGDQLDDQHVAAVINHTRTSWGNHAPTITAADVAKVRAGAK